MELFHYLVDHDFKVTFVNTKFNHKRVIIALSAENTMPQLALVSVPDGLGEEDDRNDLELIEKSNETGDPMTCMLVDEGMECAIELGRKKGLRSVVFWPVTTLMLATIMSITELISRGVLDAHAIFIGTPIPEPKMF
ncbi:UDP-glycosyltransferase 83A1-like [Zingiber officinale]|uniref:UDP-glycosyltransferase 83A1-like n=1 Tax=Zingiber officinale TaxID=94328 RepID=UPI001C4D10B9|nr:UDP-glycosyltransferase 83A1-like [Zingiber officinale]